MGIKRRDFFRVLAGGAFYLVSSRLFPENRNSYEVGVARGKDWDRCIEEAIGLVGGIKKYVKPGDRVVVKPNIAWSVPPELKANTSPLVVKKVVELCYQALASKVYVFDRSCNNPRLTYEISGIAEAARSAGAEVFYVNDVTEKMYRQITIKKADFLKQTNVNRYILEADVLINLPAAKHHSSAGLTIGMKNLMGATGDNRGKWHWQLHQAISDFNMAVRSHLTVVDATYIMYRNGPTGGSKEFLKRKDTIIASSNVVSADAETAGLFGKAPSDIGHIRMGEEKGVGKLSGYSRRSVEI